jgi:hypothetical protein
MTLTRNNIDENYYVDSDRYGDSGILQKMDTVYSEAITLNQSYWSEADIDTRFKAGDQTLWNDIYGNLPAFRRRQFYFNRIRRVTNLITGYQRKNRKSLVTVPVENSDQATSDIYSKTLFWAWKKANADEIVSRAFDGGSVTTGMGLVNIWMSYNTDPVSGDIHCDYVPYNGFLIDPYFTKHDLSDCNFIWRRQWLSKNALKAILPNRGKEIDRLQSRGNRDGKFQFQAEAYNYALWELHSYDEYWYRDLREQTILVDLQSGESVEYKGKRDKLDEFLAQFPQIIEKKALVPTTKLAIVVEGKVFYNGPSPLGIDAYPFVPVLGYYEPELPYFPWRIQGVVRALRDSQFLYNRRKVIELDIMESQINSGYKYKVDSLVNPSDVFLQGQGKGLALKKNAEMSDVEKIQPADIPPSMIQLSQMLGDEIQQISGVNEELLGMATDDKPGILSMLRQGAGLTTLQILFDQLDFSMKQMGKIFLELIQENFSPGKVKRITGEEPTEQFYQRAFGKYDVEIEEGLNTTTQKQYRFAQLIQLRELGVPVSGADLLEAATLQDKDKLIENVKKAEEQQSQSAQMQMQAQVQMLQAQIKNLEAQSVANQGLGIERISRVQENRAMAIEKISESRKDQQLATYHMAKTLKELEDMDINQIERLLEIARTIKENSVQTDQENATMLNEEIGTPSAPLERQTVGAF